MQERRLGAFAAPPEAFQRTPELLNLPPQDPEGLARGVPQHAYGIPDAWQELLRRADTAFVNPIHWAGHYPARVADRLMTQTGTRPAHMRSMSELRPSQLAKAAYMADVAHTANKKLGAFDPGERESQNVIDARPNSLWSFW